MPAPSRQGLPPERRIRRSADYRQVRTTGRKRHTAHFILYLRIREEGPTRLGLTVSRKVGNAVQRNRLKRLLREFFRTRYSLLPAHADLSIIAKGSAAGLDFCQVCAELGSLLTREQAECSSVSSSS